uniref:Uncharacterized protein n=1 Tax=Salix viminalis TaxID=40686 RepID=A0A6N2KES5_SALVM
MINQLCVNGTILVRPVTISSGLVGLNCFSTLYNSYCFRTPSNWHSSHGPGTNLDSDHASTDKQRHCHNACHGEC